MSAILEAPRTGPLSEAELDARIVERFRAAEGSDQPITGSMPFDANNPDTWPIAQWASRAAYRWRIVLAGIVALMLIGASVAPLMP